MNNGSANQNSDDPDAHMIDPAIPQVEMPKEWNDVYNALVALENLTSTAVAALSGSSKAAMESLAEECHDRRVLCIIAMQQDAKDAKRAVDREVYGSKPTEN
jgi:hypothetical protein